MTKLALITTCFALLACNSSKTPSPGKVGSLPEHMEHFDLEGFWTYRTADRFLDGGSVALGFIDSNGDLLYVWFDFSINSKSKYRRCWLMKTYNDTDGVEIIPKSKLETKVISLIESSICGGVLEELLPKRYEAIEILKTRELKLRFSEAEAQIDTKNN